MATSSPGGAATPAAGSNSIVIEAWNTVLFDKFSRFRHVIVDGLSEHDEAALEYRSYAKGAQLLDVGCGFGVTTRRLAAMVGPDGTAAGVDCAENFVRAAEAETRQAGIANARYFVADVQSDDLRGPYDHAFARFGTMFFEMPGAAMRNVRRALKPGGTFTQIVWRRREENPWMHEAELRVRTIVPVVAHEETNQVHCGPGPFSMAGPDMVSTMLRGAGFERISFERHDCNICIGSDLADAIEFAMALGPAGEVMRLAGDEAQKLKPRVIAALEEALAPFVTPHGVWAPSSSWFITAANPS